MRADGAVASSSCWKARPCVVCGTAVRRPVSQFKGQRVTCSIDCRTTLLREQGGRGGYIREGARYVYVGVDHPLAGIDGYAREARLVASAQLGRSLGPDEIVRHRNGDPLDCTPGNLIVRRIRRCLPV